MKKLTSTNPIEDGLYSHFTDDGCHGAESAEQKDLTKQLSEHQMNFSQPININSSISLPDIYFAFDVRRGVDIYE